jgi:hypothetical protein
MNQTPTQMDYLSVVAVVQAVVVAAATEAAEA